MAQHLDVQYVSFYTDGSAARKVAEKKPFQMLPKTRSVKRKRKTVYLDPVAFFGIAMSVVLITMMIVGLVQLHNACMEAKAMEAYVQELKEDNQDIRTKYEQERNLENAKQTALALGFVPQEQVKHISMQVPMEEAAPQPGIWDRFCAFLTGLFA